MITINETIKNLICFLLCITVLGSSTISSFATTTFKEDVTTISETFELEGEVYRLEREIYTDKVVATVYNDNNEIESSFTNNLLSGELNGFYIEGNSLLEEENLVQPRATTPDYKLVSTKTGSLKPAAWTTVAVIAAISALNPGAGVAAVSALASAIITDAGSSYTYKMLTYTASDSTYFYQKTVFRIYNKETGKKVGTDLVNKTKITFSTKGDLGGSYNERKTFKGSYNCTSNCFDSAVL